MQIGFNLIVIRCQSAAKKLSPRWDISEEVTDPVTAGDSTKSTKTLSHGGKMSMCVWLEVGTGRVDIESVGGEGLNNTSLWEEPASAFIDCLELRSEECEFWEPMENKQGTAHRQRFGVCVGVFVLGLLAS